MMDMQDFRPAGLHFAKVKTGKPDVLWEIVHGR